MSVDSKRRAYLQAMGIQVWEERESTAPAVPQSGALPGEAGSVRSSEAGADNPLASLGWEALQQRVAACTACQLHATRTNTVFGVGDRNAELMFIGEAPGADEDRKGEPFVGKAGQLLTEMIRSIGLSREQVYIANILKCRPPNNRDPQLSEVVCCEPFLRRQVELIQPKLIVALGRIAAHNLLKTDTGLARLRGQRYSYGEDRIPLLVTYHPAYLLRSPQDKRKAWADLLLVRKLMAER